VASLTIEPPTTLSDQDARARHFKRVINKVYEDAHWYEDKGFEPGQWIHFEVRLSYAVYSAKGVGVVLFLNPGQSELGMEQTRLLLHGSPEHLLGTFMSNDRLVHSWWSPSDGTMFMDVLPSLLRMHEDLSAELPADIVERRRDRDHDPAANVVELVLAFEDKVNESNAAWMSGCARVTAIDDGWVGGRIVVASPLYIERCEPTRSSQ